MSKKTFAGVLVAVALSIGIFMLNGSKDLIVSMRMSGSGLQIYSNGTVIAFFPEYYRYAGIFL